MLYKPSEITPLSTFKLAEIYTEAGVSDGVFNVLSGGGSTGQLLVEHGLLARRHDVALACRHRRGAMAEADEHQAREADNDLD